MKNRFAAFVACLFALLVIVPFAPADTGPKLKFDPVYSLATDRSLITEPAPAVQSESPSIKFSSDVFYDFKRKNTSAVVSTPLGKLTNVLGRKDWTLDTSTFVGADANGAALAGVAATKSFKVADQLNLFAGLGLVFAGGEKPYGGLRFGFTFSQ